MLGERVLRVEAFAKMTFWVEAFAKMTFQKGFSLPDFQDPAYLTLLTVQLVSPACWASVRARGGQWSGGL